jgi:hypothetical protein
MPIMPKEVSGSIPEEAPKRTELKRIKSRGYAFAQ